MARYTITLSLTEDSIHIDVSCDGKFFDEAEFHSSEALHAIAYMAQLMQRILMKEYLKDVVDDEKLFPELFKEATRRER